ncbi:hypothetical protein [Faecalibaculum rodentium]|uniref:hypothetical protein n=1 Tax=Faecalibaculum rodentium TaxID=1702221 RepID=UPI00272DB5AE|nr:hypothetical protein [Faecalibaculum rodentium]
MFENLVKPFTEECEKNGLKPFGVIAIFEKPDVGVGASWNGTFSKSDNLRRFNFISETLYKYTDKAVKEVAEGVHEYETEED